MTLEHRGTIWPKPQPASLWNSLGFLIVRSRWARHYVLSLDIGQRRKFINHLREWRDRQGTDDPRYQIIQEMMVEERQSLVAIIAKREALWNNS